VGARLRFIARYYPGSTPNLTRRGDPVIDTTSGRGDVPEEGFDWTAGRVLLGDLPAIRVLD